MYFRTLKKKHVLYCDQTYFDASFKYLYNNLQSIQVATIFQEEYSDNN